MAALLKHWCFLKIHDWRCVYVRHFIDTSWESESPSTQATFRCNKCGKVKVELLYGAGEVSIKELNGEQEQSNA